MKSDQFICREKLFLLLALMQEEDGLVEDYNHGDNYNQKNRLIV